MSASVRALQPPAVWVSISVELYYTFWSLSLYDIYVPIESCAPRPPETLLPQRPADAAQPLQPLRPDVAVPCHLANAV